MHHPTDRIAHTTAFVTPVVEQITVNPNDTAAMCLVVLCIHGKYVLWCTITKSDFFSNDGWMEIIYLTTHSTHFILRLYGVRHMVKDHFD